MRTARVRFWLMNSVIQGVRAACAVFAVLVYKHRITEGVCMASVMDTVSLKESMQF